MSEKSPQNQDYSHTFRYLNTTLHFREPLCEHTETALRQLIRNRRKRTRTRATTVLTGGRQSLFAKVQRLDSFQSKVRVTLGAPQRNGRFDWPLEELKNTLKAQRRGAQMSPLQGFGYTKSSFGLTREYFLITQLLDDHLDGYQWVLKHPEHVETFVKNAFALLDSLADKGIHHMDFWAGNIMQPTDVDSPLKAIDFENCFARPTDYESEVLGFQLGFLYRREIYRFITEARYDSLVHEYLQQKPTVSVDKFQQVYQPSKHCPVGRKERREVFLHGKLILD